MLIEVVKRGEINRYTIPFHTLMLCDQKIFVLKTNTLRYIRNGTFAMCVIHWQRLSK